MKLLRTIIRNQIEIVNENKDMKNKRNFYYNYYNDFDNNNDWKR